MQVRVQERDIEDRLRACDCEFRRAQRMAATAERTKGRPGSAVGGRKGLRPSVDGGARARWVDEQHRKAALAERSRCVRDMAALMVAERGCPAPPAVHSPRPVPLHRRRWLDLRSRIHDLLSRTPSGEGMFRNTLILLLSDYVEKSLGAVPSAAPAQREQGRVPSPFPVPPVRPQPLPPEAPTAAAAVAEPRGRAVTFAAEVVPPPVAAPPARTGVGAAPAERAPPGMRGDPTIGLTPLQRVLLNDFEDEGRKSEWAAHVDQMEADVQRSRRETETSILKTKRDEEQRVREIIRACERVRVRVELDLEDLRLEREVQNMQQELETMTLAVSVRSRTPSAVAQRGGDRGPDGSEPGPAAGAALQQTAEAEQREVQTLMERLQKVRGMRMQMEREKGDGEGGAQTVAQPPESGDGGSDSGGGGRSWSVGGEIRQLVQRFLEGSLTPSTATKLRTVGKS